MLVFSLTVVFLSWLCLNCVMGVSPSKTFGDPSKAVLQKTVKPTDEGERKVATFAGGCFWGIELAFQRVPGVVKTEVGYTQGHKENPTYEEVCTGTTGHAEAVQITYDSSVLPYADLLTVFWDIIDPTTYHRQGGDAGPQYRTGVYFHDEEQRIAALQSKEEEQKKHSAPIVTEILPAAKWFPAEEYHQQYLAKGGQCAHTGDLTPIRCYG